MSFFMEALDRFFARFNDARVSALQDALEMPGATVREMCERARTLRQHEVFAGHLANRVAELRSDRKGAQA